LMAKFDDRRLPMWVTLVHYILLYRFFLWLNGGDRLSWVVVIILEVAHCRAECGTALLLEVIVGIVRAVLWRFASILLEVLLLHALLSLIHLVYVAVVAPLILPLNLS
jgi:hypothetical protein